MALLSYNVNGKTSKRHEVVLPVPQRTSRADPMSHNLIKRAFSKHLIMAHGRPSNESLCLDITRNNLLPTAFLELNIKNIK